MHLPFLPSSTFCIVIVATILQISAEHTGSQTTADGIHHAIAFHLPVQSNLVSIFATCDDGIIPASRNYCLPSNEAVPNETTKECQRRVESSLTNECYTVRSENSDRSNDVSKECQKHFGFDLPICRAGAHIAKVDIITDDFVTVNIEFPSLDQTNHTDGIPIPIYAQTERVSTANTACTNTMGRRLVNNNRPPSFIHECQTKILAWMDTNAQFSDGAMHRAALRQEYYQRRHVTNILSSMHPIDTSCYPASMTLGCLMMKHGTDKGFEHGFFRSYARIFRPFLGSMPLRMLEIGVANGASMNLWTRYFPNLSVLHGIGYSNFQLERKMLLKNSLVTLYKGKQQDTKFLNWILEDGGGNYDLIIDDGSHDPAHQMISFDSLFHALNPGGLYIIEDIETSYWDVEHSALYGDPFKQPLGVSGTESVVEKWKNAIDISVNGLYSGIDAPHLEHMPMIASISFEQNMIIIRKSDVSDQIFRDPGRSYIFSDRVKQYKQHKF